jgi:hypothetical protein
LVPPWEKQFERQERRSSSHSALKLAGLSVYNDIWLAQLRAAMRPYIPADRRLTIILPALLSLMLLGGIPLTIPASPWLKRRRQDR